ncbi:YppE family protein [Sporosarcina saromensis]|uniref:YppE family protein n=1 Tax=Sporosarcina saromensis TaxID=359365 RepID=A0ABU4G7J9_9BACL|nr:YppE family protein [Sporosarcina saromensis]MDW0111592.1 YppE family protein [Sporosarcina saromensis]
MSNLYNDTVRLLAVCEECITRHAAMRELDREPDFFNEVKPYADTNHKLLDDWSDEMRQLIRTEKPKYVHLQQIESLNDAMKQFIVQSFYAKTGKKRFILSINSAMYTLKTVIDALQSEQGDGQ